VNTGKKKMKKMKKRRRKIKKKKKKEEREEDTKFQKSVRVGGWQRVLIRVSVIAGRGGIGRRGG
jgi:hypothetical protein